MDSLEQAREALIAQAAHVELGLNTPLDTKGATKELLDKLKAFLAALSRPVEGVKGEPRVKPLEWENNVGWSQANGYRVEAGDNGRFYARSNFASGLYATFRSAGSMDEAKAFAQADHEQRILSALAAPPVADSEALRERVAAPSDDAARIIYEAMSWVSDFAGPSGETIPAWDDPASALFRDKARDAARKISLVAAEAERLRFEGDLDKWMKIIGAGITGYQPEAYAVMDAACHELVALRAEARLAQAERGPAVTDEVLRIIITTYDAKVREYDRDFYADDKPEGFWARKYGTNLHSTYLGQQWAMRAALEAALHPQSAAGEEGKP